LIDCAKPKSKEGEPSLLPSQGKGKTMQPKSAIKSANNATKTFTTSLDEMKKACDAIIRAARLNYEKNPSGLLQYADIYAKKLKQLLACGGTAKEIYLQMLYTRSNLSGWRGEEAQNVRKYFDYLLKTYSRNNNCGNRHSR